MFFQWGAPKSDQLGWVDPFRLLWHWNAAPVIAPPSEILDINAVAAATLATLQAHTWQSAPVNIDNMIRRIEEIEEISRKQSGVYLTVTPAIEELQRLDRGGQVERRWTVSTIVQVAALESDLTATDLARAVQRELQGVLNVLDQAGALFLTLEDTELIQPGMLQNLVMYVCSVRCTYVDTASQ